MAAVSHEPLVILLGITPSGLNASSDGELQAWAAYVKSMQEHLFDEPLGRVIDIIQINEFGEIDPDINFDYEPLRELSDAEEAAARKNEADTHAVYVNAGVIGPEEVRQVLTEDEDSPYAGIDLSGPPPTPPVPPGGEEDPLSGQPPDAPGGAPPASVTRASLPPPKGGDGMQDKFTGIATAIRARQAHDEDMKPVERRTYGTLQIGIETRKGEVRRGAEMPADYGYIMRTTGADGDRVDVFVGPYEPTSLPAFIVEQRRLDGRVDEHKVLIGFQTIDQAILTYDRSFSDGSGPARRGIVYHTPFDNLRAWLRNHPVSSDNSAPRLSGSQTPVGAAPLSDD